MSENVEFRDITSDQEATQLMPGHTGRLHLVLFCDADAPAVEKARKFAPQVDIPADWQMVRLDTDQAEDTARWFGIGDASGMAVVHDGSILAIEYECTLEAFRQLVRVAQRQADALEDLG